jgi:phage baseplate assembly protein W
VAYDLSINKICDHRIFDEQLTLIGASPTYYAVLKFGSNLNTNAIEVREFNATDGLTNYSYTINGFTNWAISTDGRQINFNTLGIGGIGAASFADGSSQIIPQPLYMATYQTLPQNCPLHNEAAVPPTPGQPKSSIPLQKDINLTPQGGFDTVTGHSKVRQAVLKALLTAQGNNPFYAKYGSTMASTIGRKFDLFTQFSLQNSVQSTVNFLIQQQQQQIAIPLAETILKVSSVTVNNDPTDHRTIKITILILVGDYTNLPIVFNLLT